MAENTIDRVLGRATARLAAASDSARLDAELLLSRVLGRGRASFRAHADERVLDEAAARFDALVARRAAGEPVAYLLGEREFWSLALEVAPGVLIPRPDTETLVAAALEVGDGVTEAADLGTGSGAVALALASERPAWRIVATDADPVALGIARRNAARLGFERVAFALGDWCAALGARRFDLIVSNPPYVRTDDPHLTRGDLRAEPRRALVAGADGLDAIRAITACAPAHLTPGGRLLLEHGHDQAEAVAALLRDAGFTGIRHWQDLAGHTRVTGGTR